MQQVINEKLVYLRASFYKITVKQAFKELYREVRKKRIPEEWLPVKYKGFDFEYQISNYGKVKNKKGRELRASLRGQRQGTYPFITICRVGEKHHVDIHRLVALNFIKNPKYKPEVNHKNVDPICPFAFNLEWCTYSENELHKTFMKGLDEKDDFKHCIHEDQCSGDCDHCNQFEEACS